MTIMIDDDRIQDFSDNLALVVKLNLEGFDKNNSQFALIELPKDLERFIVFLPEINNKQYIMFLDDLIRYHFHIIFNFLIIRV